MVDNVLNCKEFVKKIRMRLPRGAKDCKALHNGPCAIDLDTVLFLV